MKTSWQLEETQLSRITEARYKYLEESGAENIEERKEQLQQEYFKEY